MRLAGTCRQYSKKAMPQLIKITFHKATLVNFRWPYQAKVIKMLEPSNNRTVLIQANFMGANFEFPFYKSSVMCATDLFF
jgi:hypothetical protein